VQDPLIRQKNSGMHRRASCYPHNQHIARLAGLQGHLLKPYGLCLIKEDAFACLGAFWPFVVGQLNALQLEPVPHNREAIGLAVFPLAAN
tara:strand:- start:258 stop:527 length:270 start_codon:yes stop_codon:yes gene_type:complete